MRANARAILASSLQVADIQVDQWIIDMLIHSVIIIIENIQYYYNFKLHNVTKNNTLEWRR